MNRASLFWVLFICLPLITSIKATATTSITVDFAQPYQTIDNFAASDAWTIDPMICKWQHKQQEQQIEKLADLLFSVDYGIGLSAWRFNIGAGSKEQGDNSKIKLDEQGKDYRRAELMQAAANAKIDSSKQVGQIRMLQEAVERGVTDLIAFSNSPPVWATVNGLAHPTAETSSTNLRSDQLEEFAQFLIDVVSYLRQVKHIPINYISPVNEPTWQWQGHSQEANRYNMQELKAVYLAVYQALTKAQLVDEVAIEAGEVVEYAAALSDSYYQDFSASSHLYNQGMNQHNQGLYRNYIEQLVGDKNLAPKIDNKISLHGYFSDHWTDRMGQLRDLVWSNLQAVAPNAKIWMSEVCILGQPGDVRLFHGHGFDVNDIHIALHVAKMLHRDLTRLHVSAWHWWLAVTPYDYKDGLLKINPELEAESLQTSKIFWTLGQFSRFIRPGYQRIGLAEADDLNGLMASAYKSPDGDKIVIVLVNASDKDLTIHPKVANLPASSAINLYQVYQTNHHENLAQKSDYSAHKPLVVGKQTIVTLVGSVGTDQF
ncbi:glycoside hydrolase [Catenovulum agarivorans]|uniref:glycoside hydrolase n=1 Tax=Catenovulum agarivorans TaxID=1172192 RepID=UPI0002E7FFFD|nr:glycoside hydrolase [Catenovulum agarivorans]